MADRSAGPSLPSSGREGSSTSGKLSVTPSAPDGSSRERHRPKFIRDSDAGCGRAGFSGVRICFTSGVDDSALAENPSSSGTTLLLRRFGVPGGSPRQLSSAASTPMLVLAGELVGGENRSVLFVLWPPELESSELLMLMPLSLLSSLRSCWKDGRADG